jgi:hypothetical protein
MRKGGLLIAAIAVAAWIQVRGECLAGEVPATAAVDRASLESRAPTDTMRTRALGMVERLKRDLEFKKASAQFPGFCQHWQQNLRDRELHNLSKLTFTTRSGFQTAIYTGYGEIERCDVHQSKEGFSIGTISYEEFTYYLVGPTREDAVRGQKRPIGATHTTEIFRWENGKWFY